MKQWLGLASVLVLAACSQAEAPEPEDNIADKESVESVVAGGSGVYEVATEDGRVAQTVMRDDGTYTDTDPDGNVTETGTYKTDGDRTCFDPEGDDAEYCFTNGPLAEDGTFSTTRDGEAEPITVKRVGDVPAE
ncbi:hypothetical protein P7228_14370 [Altererythrobacter arenosus]|uniref:Lipoprotein n=1 Tax=Altererythrobacter arenosus TaxID=3032592 RepID=A0ABY8FQ67_9SPHN|nr:hypothetical protein [Altererythrobacter sp. CAU 1644]WFL77159.1 hypothetical protein P7228_14370 [Altererythrobacter sp. CAU 1644]